MKEIFELFTDKESKRTGFDNPFELNGKIYATNGYALIRCNASLCDFDVSGNEVIKSTESIIPEINTNKVIDIETSFFDQYLVDEYTDPLDCEECEGNGEVEWWYESYSEYHDCPVCDGRGEKKNSAVKTGKKVISGNLNEIIQIGNSHFAIWLIYKLIQVRSIVGGDIILVSMTEDARKPMFFKVGIYEILIMPVMKGDYDKVVLKICQD